ncbi:hypothetical protein A6770_22120 [Nostoc minutum NIES-26]|uniref:DUF4280 domain-containing protein n=1 Tax=Nostoc minutum NIES-26 TaxID=1844469 RepID=A0A367R0H2_9NOSO|nr:hypothetical protein A6770_22120 [Nostoc minutum NIES-26]
MPQQVSMGATITCNFGSIPSSLVVTPQTPPAIAGATLAATVMDFAPVKNIPPFGMCSSPSNPAVAAATAAASGVLTPVPCMPNPVGKWQPGAIKAKIGKFAALTNTSICNCAWAGVIQITNAGQIKVQIF